MADYTAKHLNDMQAGFGGGFVLLNPPGDEELFCVPEFPKLFPKLLPKPLLLPFCPFCPGLFWPFRFC